jgi:hypothetical protein
MNKKGGQMKIVKRYCVIALLGYCFIALLGCATIIEGTKGFMGISTRSLEKARKEAIIKTFNYDYFTCYTKTLDILKSMGAYVYMQSIKKHMIAIYVSESDTTPVGLFFKEVDSANIQVEVSSLSTYAKEFIAGKVFSVLDKKVSLEELEAQINAKKELENK